MVSLPLFKLAALFVRHISKYGGNLIKAQAHNHPKFRAYAAYYGQKMHQINMRMAVTLLKNANVDKRTKEKEQSSFQKFEEQSNQESVPGEKNILKEKIPIKEASPSVWKRKFRSLPEAKAVDLFAGVLGDTFVLIVAGSLIFYEYIRTKGKPDVNTEKINELCSKIEELQKRESDLEKTRIETENRFTTLEQTLEHLEKKSGRKDRPSFV